MAAEVPIMQSPKVISVPGVAGGVHQDIAGDQGEMHSQACQIFAKSCFFWPELRDNHVYMMLMWDIHDSAIRLNWMTSPSVSMRDPHADGSGSSWCWTEEQSRCCSGACVA